MRWPWVSRTLYERLEMELREAYHLRRVAEDRLYAAWKDGYQIPARQIVDPAPKEVHILPDKLRAYVENWESPEVRMELDQEAQRMHFEMGMPEDRVLEIFERRQADSQVSA